MKLDFKKKLYDNYLSTHNSILKGEEISLRNIQSKFGSFNYYYKKLLPHDKSITILDIGCGDGNFVFYLQSLGYQNVFGVDISNEQIEAGLNLGIKNLIVSDFLSFLSSHKNYYDLIIARDILEHFKPQEVYENLLLINNSLKPNGFIIMQVPNGQGIFYTSYFYSDFTHEIPFSSNSINQLFLNTGFRKSVCFPVNPYPKSIFGFIRNILWKIKVLQTRFWKAVETGNHKGIFTSNIIALGQK